jgi:DNA-binding NarL/FixJ family response regulator
LKEFGDAKWQVTEYRALPATNRINFTSQSNRKMDKKVPLHIFIVENCGLFVRLLDYVFSKHILYRFLDFKSGEDCLKNLHINPELVILDYSLPGMNGLETLQELKEQHPAAHVIMMLSEEDRRLPAEFLNAGAADYVIKDGREEQVLIEKIETYLAKEKVFRQIRSLQKRPLVPRKLYYALLILILLSAGIYYYQ